MLNRVVDQFVRQNASLALQQNLLLTELDAKAIVAKLNPVQMVMLNQHLPSVKTHVISLVNQGLVEDWKDFNHKKYWDDVRIECENPCYIPYVINMNREFEKFYDTVLEDLIRDKARTPINALPILKKHLNDNTEICFNALLALEGNYNEIADFAVKAKEMAIDMIQNSKTHNINEIYNSLFEDLCNQFKTINPGIVNQLITHEYLEAIQNAEIALSQLTSLTLEERFEIIFKSPSNAIAYIPDYINVLINYVYYSLQTEDREFLTARLTEMKAWRFKESVLKNREINIPLRLRKFITSDYNGDTARYSTQSERIGSTWSEDILPMIFTDNFIEIIKNLPTVTTYDGIRNMGLEANEHNRRGLVLAAKHIASGNDIHQFDFQFQTLGAPTQLASYPTMIEIAGKGAGILMFSYGMLKVWDCAYAFFNKNSNVRLLNHIASLPASPKPDFLSREEEKAYMELINKITDMSERRAALKELRQYLEYASGICTLSRTDLKEIEKPVTITLTISSSSISYKTFEHEAFVDYINSCNERKIIATLLDVPSESLTVSNPRIKYIKGYSDFIAPFVKSIREKLTNQMVETRMLKP